MLSFKPPINRTDNVTWSSAPTTSFAYPNVGFMHQGLLDFGNVASGARTWYVVGTVQGNSSVIAVTPIPSSPERFAIYGDFGLLNDQCIKDATKLAQAGAFDSGE